MLLYLFFVFFAQVACGQPDAIQVSPRRYGQVDIGWTPVAGALQYQITVEPVDYLYNFTGVDFPDPQQWIIDNSGDTRDLLAVNITDGALHISVTNDSDCWGSRGRCPLVYRRPPPQAIMETAVNMSETTQFNAAGGIVVFNARINMHLVACLVAREAENGSLSIVMMGNGAQIGSSLPVNWDDNAIFLRMIRDSGTNTFTCAAKNDASQDWATVQTVIVATAVDLGVFYEGDLWVGLIGKGSSSPLFPSPALSSPTDSSPLPSSRVSFAFFRLASGISAAAVPPDLYGRPDACAAGMSSIVPQTVVVDGAHNSTTVKGLPSYFPFMATVRAVGADGVVSPPSPIYPFFYARPMPPGWENMGLWLDAKDIPAGKVSSWKDSSASGHDFAQSVTAMQPQARVAALGPYTTGAVTFTKSASTNLATGGDAIDLGVSRPFTGYFLATLSQTSFQFFAARGQSSPASEIGWSFAYNLQPPSLSAPGHFGVRTYDALGFGAGARSPVRGTTIGKPTVFTFSMVPDPEGGGTMWFPRLKQFVAIDGDMGTQIPGFYSTATSTMGYPVSVDYNLRDGLSTPTNLDSKLDMRIGTPASPSGSPTWAFDGDMYSVMLFRDGHDNVTVLKTTQWLNAYYARACLSDSISPNASSVGQCVRAVQGDSCTQACNSGYIAVAGTASHLCSGGSWTGGHLVCARSCPSVSSPNYADKCIKTLWDESFGWNAPGVYAGVQTVKANAQAGINNTYFFDSSGDQPGLAPYSVFPAVPESMALLMWSRDVANGLLTASTNSACDRTPVSILGLPSAGWDAKVPFTSLFRATTRVRLDSPAAEAGVVLRLLDAQNYYLLSINMQGVKLVGVSQGGSVVLANDSAVQIVVGSWYVLDMSVLGSEFSGTVALTDSFGQAVSQVSMVTVSDSSVPYGSAGLYADGSASFDFVTIRSSCEAGNTCNGLGAGSSCSFQCKAGFQAQGTGTFSCGDDGQYSSGLVCLLQPPIMHDQSNFTVTEHAMMGTLVSPAVNVTHAYESSAVSFRIESQEPFNDTFSIGFCSGEFAVLNQARLNINATGVRTHTLLVRALTDDDEAASTTATMTINVVDIDDPPYFVSAPVLSVIENVYGPLSPPIVASDSESSPIVYSIVFGNEAGLFSIDAISGIISVNAPGLDYEAHAVYTILVRSSQSDNPGLSVTTSVTINVIDANDGPVTYPQRFTVDENLCSDGAIVGNFVVTDYDQNNLWNQIEYSITTNDLRTGMPAFGIDPASGTLNFTQGFTFGPNVPTMIIDGLQAKTVFRIVVKGCDSGGLCASQNASIYVTPNNTAQLQCSVQGVNALASPTAGGQIVTLVGANFAINGVVNATYVNDDGVKYAASACSVRDVNTMQCTTVEGYGSQLFWNVTVDGVVCTIDPSVVTSYAAPTLISVTYPTSPYVLTSGNTLLTLTGTNFGPAGTPITIFYGANGQWQASSITFATPHVRITARSGEGCGANLPVYVLVGNTNPVLATAAGQSTTFSYSPQPNTYSYAGLGYFYVLSSYLPAPYSWPGQAPALGGQTVYIYSSDNFFGPDSPSAPLRVAAVNDATGQKKSTVCSRAGGVSAHSLLYCTVPAGVGQRWRWEIDVCGQLNVPTCNSIFGDSSFPCNYQRYDYADPAISSISGPGAFSASTEGGQAVYIVGRDFGPVWSTSQATPSPFDYVQLRRGATVIRLRSCSVSSTAPPTISCLSSEGYGVGYTIWISIGGKSASYKPAVQQLGYGNPVVASFSGDGAYDAATAGSQQVLISGTNFGPVWGSHIAVNYTTTLSLARSTDNTIPYNGVYTLQPTACSMSTPHRVISCFTAPGAGTAFSWSITVDGLRNREPTTAYARPSITGVSLLSGNPTASSVGGEWVRISGQNFGPASLVQSITYGPSGLEYTVKQWTWINDTEIRFVTLPGVGTALRLILTTGDQVNDFATSPTFDYTAPKILSLSPASGPTFVQAVQPNIISVTGTNLGLASSNVDVVIGWGNSDDATFTRLSVASRYPSLADLTNPSFVFRPGDNETLTFIQPAGLGARRAVRIVPYLRSLGIPTTADILAVNATGRNDVFDYFVPSISFVSVQIIMPNTTDEALCIQLGVCQQNRDPSANRKLIVYGQNFGPSQNSTQDLVSRFLEIQADGSSFWSNAAPTIAASSALWSDEKIIAFTVLTGGTLQIRNLAKDPWAQPVQQVSPTFSFKDLSPSVGRLVGANTNLTTAGGQILGVVARNLYGGNVYNVTIGGSNCVFLNGPTGSPVPPSQVRDRIINNGSSFFPPDYEWTLWVVVPPGQGADVPVIVLRDNVPSAADQTISYAPPLLRNWRLCSAPGVCNVPALINAATVISAPTIGGRIRLEGTNLGTCPIVAIASSFVAACIAAPNSTPAKPVYMPNPNVLRDSTFFEFPVPEGEGASPPGSPSTPYTVVLDVGGQSPQWASIVYRYSVPTIQSVSPPIVPTRGGVQISLTGANFGFQSIPTVAVGNPQLNVPWQYCANVVRSSHFSIGCTVPQGYGGPLFVRVSVAGVDGTSSGEIFSFQRPNITAIVRTYPDSSMASLPRNSTVKDLYINVSSNAQPMLVGDPSGGYITTFVGNNFGPHAVNASCAFALWPGHSPTDVPTCNGMESFFGEGEIADVNILSWTHEEVRIVMPPGIGVRLLTLKVGGQVPVVMQPNWQYENPILTGYTSSEPIAATGGTKVSLTGYYLPLGFYNASLLRFPMPLPLDPNQIMPTQQLAIRYGAATSPYGKCLTSSIGLDGTTPSWLSSCIQGSVLSQSLVSLTYTSPSGIGKDRPVQVQIYDSGQMVATSNYLNISYAPPKITYMEPSPLFMTTDTSGFIVRMRGTNFGSIADVPSWEPEQRQLSVMVDDLPCVEPARVQLRDGTEAVQCITSAGMVVGFKTTNISVAYQEGFVNSSSAVAILAVCRTGFYGRPGETCLGCVLGAVCPGFVSLPPPKPDGPQPTPDEVTYGGTNYYPIPLPGFYDLNATEAIACPPQIREQVPSRDVCVVACQPPESCLGGNICAEGYVSTAPTFRCGSCAKQYYRYGGDCIKCPDSPASLYIGFALILIAVIAVGWFLNHKGINITFVSIGIDFFQILSIFANAKVKWPQTLKELWRILSAFNLNVEIVAPECLVPDVSFKNKWAFVMIVPLAVAGILLVMHAIIVVYKRVCRRQKKWEVLLSHADTLVAMYLLLFYLAYLYLTQQTFNIFNCGPVDPPDGRNYLLSTFEECNVPGGTHLTLLPFGVLTLLGYTLGYPAFLAAFFWRNRERIMEDQLLRAKGIGEDKLTNPNAYHLRRRYKRTYYQFKPDQYFWILAIILRKLTLAITALMFRRNSAFQLAAALLIMFLAYAGQVRYSPYMSVQDYDSVLRHHKEMSFVSPLHARLEASLADIATRGRKRARMNVVTLKKGAIDPRAMMKSVGGWLFNYNTVEAVLLFAAVIICLMGIMYQATGTNSYYFTNSREGITAVVIGVIVVAILYFVGVLVAEIVIKLHAVTVRERAPRKGSTRGISTEKEHELVEANIGKVDATMNPMFLSAKGITAPSSDSNSIKNQTYDAIMSCKDVPPPELWTLFRCTFDEVFNQVQGLSTQLTSSKRDAQRMRDLLDELGIQYDAQTGVGDAAPKRSFRMNRSQFAPRVTDGSPGADSASIRSVGNSLQREGNPLPRETLTFARSALGQNQSTRSIRSLPVTSPVPPPPAAPSAPEPATKATSSRDSLGDEVNVPLAPASSPAPGSEDPFAPRQAARRSMRSRKSFQ